MESGQIVLLLDRFMVTKIKLSAVVFFVCFLLPIFSGNVWAAAEEYRQCRDDEPCEIGEFLFDDSFTPIATASCALTSRDPDGDLYLDEVSMTARPDGWYFLAVTTASQDHGLYRSQICCTHELEYICLDKSFVITDPPGGLTDAQVADAVWDADRASHDDVGSFGENLQNPSSVTVEDIWAYPQRSLTNFGTLVADVWSYSSRSLNSITSLVNSIWDDSDRTLTDNDLDDGELATASQVNTINNNLTNNTGDLEDLSEQIEAVSGQVRTNRNFLERLVNAPIVETFIEEGAPEPVDLQAKIQETKNIAKSLSADTINLQGQIATLNTSWDDASYDLALTEITTASRILGVNTEEIDNPSDINSMISWLNKKWDNPIINNLSTQTASALANISSISREIKSYGKTFISKQYLDIVSEHIGKLAEVIGQADDPVGSNTLFGYIAYLESTHDTLIKQSLEIEEVLQNWNTYANSEKDLKLARIKRTVLAANQVNGGEVLLKSKAADPEYRENLALSLQGLVNSNLTLLAQDADQMLQNIWLERGSVIFRSLVSNPSSTIEQEVDIKYYLPQEIGVEHIMKIEDGFTAVFDAEKNALCVQGKVLLAPEETKTFILEVVDVWIIPEEEIASIGKQTDTLFESLKNTSYFAQGATIKADIEAHLDKIAFLQENTQTPELEIKSHREAMLELQSAQSKLDSLKTIVASAGSVGTVFGFVGGVQTVAVWGIIIVLVAGFVFLAIYLKMIAGSSKSNLGVNKPIQNNTKAREENLNTPARQQAVLKKSIAQHKDASTLDLVKDIINLKLNLKNKFSARKRSPFLIVVVLGLVATIFILILMLKKANNSNNELMSPIENPTVQTDDQADLLNNQEASSAVELSDQDSSVATSSAVELDDQDPLSATSSAVEADETEGSGLVLGAKIEKDADQLIREAPELNDTEPTADELVGLDRLVLIRIPTGSQIINVRAKPTINSDILLRLWVNQTAFILEEADSWVLVNTSGADKESTVEGWVLKDFTHEFEP